MDNMGTLNRRRGEPRSIDACGHGRGRDASAHIPCYGAPRRSFDCDDERERRSEPRCVQILRRRRRMIYAIVRSMIGICLHELHACTTTVPIAKIGKQTSEGIGGLNPSNWPPKNILSAQSHFAIFSYKFSRQFCRLVG